MFKLFRRGSAQHPISETGILRGEFDNQGHHLTQGLQALLDQVIALFAPSQGLMAEILITVPGTTDLITLEVRPDTSPAMCFRVRAGEGIVGKVFQSGIVFAGAVQPESQPAGGSLTAADEAHLYSTRSVLAIPLQLGSALIGVLNVESPADSTFDTASLSRLRDSHVLEQIGSALAHIKRDPLTQEQLIADLIDKLRQRIAFAFNPEDMAETYYQILRVAGQVVRPTGISGGLILVRDEFQNLVEGSAAGPVERKLYAVRAARTGAFNSDPEWALKGQSIARRIMLNRKGEVIPNAHADPDYRDSGTGLAQTSELIVPLVDGDNAFGVIGLVSPGLNAFDQSDLANLEQVTTIAVYALERAEEFRRRKRHSDQLRLNRKLLEVLGLLFPENMRHLTMDQIGKVRNNVSDLILSWALEQTNSEHGVFVLAETTEGQQTHLVIHENRTTGTSVEGGFTRWPATEGVTGRAYARRRTAYQPDVSVDDTYIPYFAGVRSEVASPLRIGDTVLGVLDVECNSPHHFTSDYIQWVEFLAEQAAFALATIDRAVKTHIELTLADLSRTIDQGIDDMRRRTELHTLPPGDRDPRAAITVVRDKRYDLVRAVIDTLLPLTGSWVGRFLIALNAYNGEGDAVNVDRGRLFYLVSTDRSEETNPDNRFFPLTNGVSGRALSEQRQIVFNDLASRPGEYFDSNPERDSQSGIFMPVWEGTRISGILNIESEHAGAFTPEMIRACQIAADLASKVVTTARLRILVLLRQQLRDFETVILRLQSADLNAFVRLALTNAADLSSINAGSGMLVLSRQPFSAGTPIEDRRFWMSYAPNNNRLDVHDDEHTEIDYPVFVEAMRTKRPVLILDNQALPDRERQNEPWPGDTRSIICVPLLRPTEGGRADNREAAKGSARASAGLDDRDAVGVLALGHRNPAEFSEYDKEMLSLFAESVMQGLKNITLLQARRELIRQVRHDFSEAVKPLTLDTATVKRRLDAAVREIETETAREQLASVVEVNNRVDALVFLLTDLMTWFFDLTNDDLQPEQDTALPMDVEDVLRVQRRPIAALALALKRRTVQWDVPVGTIYIQGGDTRARLIRAALFQYLDNAIKYGENDTIAVTVYQQARNAVFAVSSAGDPIPVSEWEDIYELYYQGSNITGQNTGSGIGLFQVKEIARRLGGDAYYRPDPSVPRRNVFYLTVPTYDSLAPAKGGTAAW